MPRSSHLLHPSVIDLSHDKSGVLAQIHALNLKRRSRLVSVPAAAPAAPSITVPLTTVSLSSNFDAYVNIQFPGDTSGATTTLLVDSGNSVLIVPSWEQIQGFPGYKVLGSGHEPWGSPANIVQGPIEIPTADGGVYTLQDCVFYACTGAPRTANFGAGCLVPWSSSGWNTPAGVRVTMRAPLSYNTDYPFAEFNYAPAASIFGPGSAPMAAEGSNLILYRSQPSGYTFLNTIQNLEWMSLRPKSLQIGTVNTAWPGSVRSPIAMIDTGGGPVFLSDPNEYLQQTQWPVAASCPTWTSGSQSCQCVSDDLTLELAGEGTSGTYSYRIDTSTMPSSVQGLTLVMCKVNEYMRGQQGMNIGGISALANHICIDFANGRVGMKPIVVKSQSAGCKRRAGGHSGLKIAQDIASFSLDASGRRMMHGNPAVSPVVDRVRASRTLRRSAAQTAAKRSSESGRRPRLRLNSGTERRHHHLFRREFRGVLRTIAQLRPIPCRQRVAPSVPSDSRSIRAERLPPSASGPQRRSAGSQSASTHP